MTINPGVPLELRDYLPLGCLCFENTNDDGNEDVEFEKWRDVPSFQTTIGGTLAQTAEINELIRAGWIKVRHRRCSTDTSVSIYRIYILPADVGNRLVDRHNRRLNNLLESLVMNVDISAKVWEAVLDRQHFAERFDPCATAEDASLFYIYNTLPSPAPDARLITERYRREALEDLLDPKCSPAGLKSNLYPYQRRSAGLMLQRECAPRLDLDPRLEPRRAPDGSRFYFAPRELTFLRHPRYYEACRGGILSETMGLGKTVMVLALILATKHHVPGIPPQYNTPTQRTGIGSLVQMAISSINRHSVPWRVEFDRIKHATGQEFGSCLTQIEKQPPQYEIPQEPSRWNRTTVITKPKKMTLAATTLLVVPSNLFKQWQSEIQKHVETGVLRVLPMDDSKKPLPPPDVLRTYDIILFTRNRWQLEHRDGSDERGRRQNQRLCYCSYIGATRIRDCNCVKSESLYDSPLKNIHFKRLVVDEGHSYSNTDSQAVSVATSLVTTDHKWVISGTPAKNLFGIEVDALIDNPNALQQVDIEVDRDSALEQRRHFSVEDTNGAIKNIGKLASKFLQIRPWVAAEDESTRADWDEYIYRHEGRKRTYSGFSLSLRRTLESLIIRTRPSDIEKDLDLPPLNHQIIRLEPSFFDKVTANLFALVLTANAVTSERTDVDYLFHKNSSKPLRQLISNLRQSAFFWTGFSEMDVQAGIQNTEKYLTKESAIYSERDRQLLTKLLENAKRILLSDSWKGISRTHEIGLFVNDWPVESAAHWAFAGAKDCLLTGVSQVLEAQRHVNEQGGAADPGEGLSGVGIRALLQARTNPALSQKEEQAKKAAQEWSPAKSSIPASSLDGEPVLKRRTSLSLPNKPRNRSDRSDKNNSPRKRRNSELDAVPDLPSSSPYRQSQIIGTTSSKLSYLLSRILSLYETEKILIFYEGDNLAYYIAQSLEFLHINHEIYAKSLKSDQKSEYVVRFDEDARVRVLLMDVNQAAHGLNMPSASRIFFINPVCRPNVEAQAIKRAHRIGQTRTVHVETLILKGTLEEDMFERARRMTHVEHMDAKTLEDDGGIREIIQNVEYLPVEPAEFVDLKTQMAPLDTPQQLWGRPGWREAMKLIRGHSPSKRRKLSERQNDTTVARIKPGTTTTTMDAIAYTTTHPDPNPDSGSRPNLGRDVNPDPSRRAIGFVRIPTSSRLEHQPQSNILLYDNGSGEHDKSSGPTSKPGNLHMKKVAFQ